MKVGRPSKYKKEFAEKAFYLCLLGLKDKDLSRNFGVSESTLNLWKNEHPEFSEALKDGREGADTKVADSLYQKALAGDTTACIFWLKNRHKEYWRDSQQKDVNVNVRTAEDVSDEELWNRMVAIAGEEGSRILVQSLRPSGSKDMGAERGTADRSTKH